MLKFAILGMVLLMLYYVALSLFDKSPAHSDDALRSMYSFAWFKWPFFCPSSCALPSFKMDIFSGAFVIWSFIWWTIVLVSYKLLAFPSTVLHMPFRSAKDSKERVVVVTGGAGALGRSLVRELLKRESMTVLVLDKQPLHFKDLLIESADSSETMTTKANEIAHLNGRLLYYPCDLSVPSQICQVVDCIRDQVSQDIVPAARQSWFYIDARLGSLM
jgi:hypothetical protein